MNIPAEDKEHLLTKYIGTGVNFREFDPIIPIYLIITELAYPMGGGEAFLYDTISLMTDQGYLVVWIAFREEIAGKPKKDIIKYSNYCIFHTTSEVYNVPSIVKFIEMYNPNIIHTQGHINCLLPEVIPLLKNKIPFVVGYHFWNGLINFGKTGNVKMIENCKKNKIDKTYVKLGNMYNVHQYVASEFMNRVLKLSGYPTISTVIYPLPLKDSYIASEYSPDRPFVTITNIHVMKGGELLYEVIKSIDPKVRFLAIRNETGSEKLDEQIKSEFRKHTEWEYSNYSNIKDVYQKSRIIILPVLADETFCRVAFEAASNGIPIITTGNGFIKELLGDSAVYLDNSPREWEKMIYSLYNDPTSLRSISAKCKEQVYNFERQRRNIVDLLVNRSKMSKKINIALYCPWGDQGLGIQCRYYAKVLENYNYRVSIFSFRSYFTDKLKLQNCPDEWNLKSGNVYYSLNDRESVTETELKSFVYWNNIGTFIIPEICWDQIFEKTKFLKSIGVRVIAVPNIEIVIKSELPKYSLFDKILCNTHVCYDVLKREVKGVPIEYIGHGIDRVYPLNKGKLPGTVQFLHVSGYNAIIRKQTHKILESFRKVKGDYQLRILIQGEVPDQLLKDIPSKVEIISEKLPYNDVLRFYSESHVSVQVSSHEGLGIGFYESIAHGTPVISIDVPPHNEVIIPHRSGWLLNCSEKRKLCDNPDGMVEESFFNTAELTSVVNRLIENQEEIINMIGKTTEYFNKNWKTSIFSGRFLRSVLDGK